MPGGHNIQAPFVQRAQDNVAELVQLVAVQHDVEGQGGEEEYANDEEQQEGVEGHDGEGEQATPPRAIRAPARFQAGEGSARLSPQERKKKQSQAKKAGKNRLEDGTILCLGGMKRFKPPPGMK